jgi:general L-amino acid transport system permease protein
VPVFVLIRGSVTLGLPVVDTSLWGGLMLTLMIAATGRIIVFSAATLAEVVRGGLQGVPRGQEEAAAAIGLRTWQTMLVVVLPQALRLVIPALVGTFISFVKGTSLVAVVGLFDLLGTAMLATANPQWVGLATEPLVFAAALFWIICFAMSRYSRRLEGKYRVGQL